MANLSIDQDIKYHAQLTKVQEVSLFGTANHSKSKLYSFNDRDKL